MENVNKIAQDVFIAVCELLLFVVVVFLFCFVVVVFCCFCFVCCFFACLYACLFVSLFGGRSGVGGGVTDCSTPIPVSSAVTIRSQQFLALVNAYRFGAQLLQVRGLGEIEDDGVLVSLELDVALRSVLPE